MNETSSPKPSPKTPPSPAKGKRIRRALKRVICGPENKDFDKIWEKRAYLIIRGFGIFGTVVLLWLAVISPWLRGTSENGSISGNETVQNAYYFLIFVGGALATSIATWRGRQSEQQLRDSRLERQNSRFERALDMATDQKSMARRAVGFRILQKMLFTWRENFDGSKETEIDILRYLVFNSFRRKRKQEKTFRKLYDDSKTSSGSNKRLNSISLFEEIHNPDLNGRALALWKGIVNWNMRKWDNSPVLGIYATKATSFGSSWFVFTGINLKNLQFFVESDEGEIIPSTQGTPSTQRAMANFKRSCFLVVEMHGATVDHVDFSGSHFYRINLEGKSGEKCEMSCVGTIFDKANLIDCNFRGADFEGASFAGITTFDVIFDEANLTDCNFEGATLEGASFIGTNISDSDFSEADNLTEEQFLQGAYWITRAKLKFPSNFSPNFAVDLPNQPPTPEMIRKWKRARLEKEIGFSL